MTSTSDPAESVGHVSFLQLLGVSYKGRWARRIKIKASSRLQSISDVGPNAGEIPASNVFFFLHKVIILRQLQKMTTLSKYTTPDRSVIPREKKIEQKSRRRK